LREDDFSVYIGGIMMKILVTGATGFLGSHIVDSLNKNGHEVRALARTTSDLTHLRKAGAEISFGDVSDYESLLAAASGVDAVIHAAAIVMPGWGKWEDYERANVNGTKNALDASEQAGVKRFVYISSFTVIGNACNAEHPIDETEPSTLVCTPDTYYDYAKLLAEQLALDYHKQGRVSVTVLRPGMLYGPRDRYIADRFHWLVRLPISFFPGRGNPRAPLIYVSDVADCAVLAAITEKAAGEIYYVVPGGDVRFRHLASAMAKAAGKPDRRIDIPVWLLHGSGVVLEWWGKMLRMKQPPLFTRAAARFFTEDMNVDGSKAKRDLGWEPKVSIEEGCDLYVQWRKSKGNGKGAPSIGSELDLVGEQEKV
jgi:nucleoside-diphosphate-sugar epimerase